MCARAKKEILSFEQASSRLEEIVARMDNPETGLEEMIALTEEGLKLIRNSRSLLKEAELRIQQLEKNESDNTAPAPPSRRNNDDFSLI
ncbi:MAG: exodeoxyribonuclease VII small subunit [Akkermansia sp.]|nr:exodeoxyribonuclease VII small subunit [Akkermansia sp.]